MTMMTREIMNKSHFSFEIVRDGEVLAGASTLAAATLIATTLRGEVREAVIVEFSGELSFGRDSVWFQDKENRTNGLNDALAQALGVKFPASNRGAGNNIELGYVTITIKAANNPEKAIPVIEDVEAER